jgi:hypothetical protein
MTELAWVWALGLSGLAAWLGFWAGFRRAITATAVLFWECGVRSVDSHEGTITFRDGTTHKEPRP